MKNKMHMIRRCQVLAMAGIISAGTILPAGTALAIGPGDIGAGCHISRPRRPRAACGRHREYRKYGRGILRHRRSQPQCLEKGKRGIPDAGRHIHQQRAVQGN